MKPIIKEMKESTIQKQIVELLSYHSRRFNFAFFAIPNEGFMLAGNKLSVEQSAKLNHLKKMGLTPGIPDIEIVHNGKSYFFEVKKKGEKPTEKQKIIHEWLLAAGAIIEIVSSIEEMTEKLIDFGIIKGICIK